jgi:hypothetical protein
LTYEDLIVAIANEVPKLSGSGLKLLLRLIASGIELGSCEVVVSKYWLAERTGLSREGVTLAARQIAHLVGTESSHGVNTKFVLPAEWFTPQRSLFPVDTRLESRLQSPGNLAAGSQLSRRQPANNPGDSRQETWPQSPNNLATLAKKPGGFANFPGDSRQEIGLEVTQTQSLTDAPDLIRSDQRFVNAPTVSEQISQITSAIHINPGQEQQAEELCWHLREFMRKYGARGIPPSGPASSTLSRCLAIAPLETLIKSLATMADRKLGRPREWIWFVLLFAQNLRGIEKELMLDAIKQFNKRKPPQAQTAIQFKDGLLQQSTAGVRTMH